MLYEETLQKLQLLLREETIIETLSKYEQKLSTMNHQNSDKTAWYAASYPVIIKKFEDTRGIIEVSAWIERIALLSSWLPSIPNPRLNKEAIENMVYLENIFHEVKLEEVGVESFLGEMNTRHHGEMIFDTKERPPVLVKTFLETADQITNLSGRWENTLSTTTKLLHFMCPHLFPIFDRKISNVLFGENQNYAKYHCYIFALREFLHTSGEAHLLKKTASEKGISVIRVVDTVLFNQ